MNAKTRHALGLLREHGSAIVYAGSTREHYGTVWLNVSTAKALERAGCVRQLDVTRAEVVVTERALARR